MLAQTVAIGIQDFEKIRERNVFYIDKTPFIKEWWERNDDVTLITRPRRFGKTLNLSMLECFFSNKYEGRSDLFEGLAIWEEAKYRMLQGTYPVIFLSFAGVKQNTYEGTCEVINQKITDVFNTFSWITKEEWFTDADRSFYSQVNMDMKGAVASTSLNKLCGWNDRAGEAGCKDVV